MTGRFEATRANRSSRFRSTPPSYAADDFYAQQIFQGSTSGSMDYSTDAPPPPVTSPAPLSFINCEEASAASSMCASPITPQRRSPLNRTPSAKTKNRYRDLSRKALPTERGRLKVVRAEKMRLQEEARLIREAAEEKLMKEQRAQLEKLQLQKKETSLTTSVLNQLLYWLTEQEFLAVEHRREQQRLERLRKEQLELEKVETRKTDQLLLVQAVSGYVGWLMEQGATLEEQKLEAEAARERRERLLFDKRQADHAREQSLLTREFTILMSWLYEQEDLLNQTRLLKQEQEQRQLQQQKLQAIELRLVEEDMLLQEASTLLVWLHHQELKMEQDKRDAAQLLAKQQAESKQRILVEQCLLLEQTSGLIMWLVRQEQAQEEARQTKQHEETRLAEAAIALAVIQVEQEQEARAQKAAELQARLALEATRRAEQEMLLEHTALLVSWTSEQEAIADKQREIALENEEGEEEEVVGVVTPPTTPSRPVTDSDEDDVGVETPPSTPSDSSTAAAFVGGAAVAGAIIGGAVLANDASVESTVKKSHDTPATADATLSVASGDTDALMIPSSFSSESAGSSSNVSSLSTASKRQHELVRVSSDGPVTKPRVVGRRIQSTGGGMTVMANGRVRSSNRLTRSAPSHGTRRNSSTRGMQSPGVVAPRVVVPTPEQQDLWETASVSSVTSSTSSLTYTLATVAPVTVIVKKASKDVKAGISFKKSGGSSSVCVSKIAEDGLFANTDLKVGYEVITINGETVEGKALKEAAMLIRQSEGDVAVVAQPPAIQQPKAIPAFGPAWPTDDPGYHHAANAGTLWQTLVGQHVRFPKTWWNGARCPSMGVDEVVPTKDFARAHLWKYIAVDCVEKEELVKFVPEPSSQGRVLLHLVIRDETWKPVQDVAFGCYFPLDAAESKNNARVLWMAVRKRSVHTPESTSLIDPILANECNIDDIASKSPLGGNGRLKNDYLRPVFGDEPPERTVFILESELVKRLRNAMDDVSSPFVSVMLLDLFLF